jgi:hypothetical protein
MWSSKESQETPNSFAEEWNQNVELVSADTITLEDYAVAQVELLGMYLGELLKALERYEDS